jgi:hypothetical protein
VPPHLVVAVSFGQPEEPKPKEDDARPGEAPAEPAPEAPAEPSADSPAEPAPEPATPDADAPADPPADTPADAPAENPAPPPPPPLRLVSIIPALADPHQQPLAQTGRLTLRVAGTVLTLYLNDTVAGGDFAAQAQQALMALDGDKNGYLEKSEVPDNAAPQLGQFDAVDTDEDGKVYPAEIITFLQQQQAGLRAQIHLKASDREDALFAALDQNNDERLDAFEVEQVPEQLALLDASGDGWLTRDEVP